MQSVIRGNSITLDAQYKNGAGVVEDPTTPLVSVYNSSNVAQLVGAIPTRVSTGVYTYAYAVSGSADPGTWYIIWSGTVDGQALTTTEYFEVILAGSITPSDATYTYDLSTPIGKIRMYIDDRDLSLTSSLVPLEERSAIFSDEELTAMYYDCVNDVMYASARALVTISGNRQLLVRTRRIGKTVVDYGNAAENLREQAMQLIKMSNMQPADALAEISWTDPAFRQILVNAQLRKV